MQPQPPRYIAVEGPIGVGKTSLAKRIAAEFNARILLEAPEENPFLKHFYENPRQSALPTQLCFLLQRARQLDLLRQKDIFRSVWVADFMMEKDWLFARLNLDRAEFELYEPIHAYVTVKAPTPDLVIYMQAPVDVLLQRIRMRGRYYEQRIAPDYLEWVSQSYAHFFSSYSAAPVLTVNSVEIDLVAKEEHYRALLAQIRAVPAARYPFNPFPLANP